MPVQNRLPQELNSQTISLKITPELKEILKKIESKTGKSKSQIIRDLIKSVSIKKEIA